MDNEIRIPVTRLKDVQDVVFGRKSWRGPALALRLKAKHVTLWSWLNRNGLPVKMAEPMAVELEKRAQDLTEAADKLREEATAVLNT